MMKCHSALNGGLCRKGRVHYLKRGKKGLIGKNYL